MTDDFINALSQTVGGKDMIKGWRSKCGPQKRLSLSEVLTLNILRFHHHIFDLKAFHSLAECVYKGYFPRLPNYENFVKATNGSFIFVVLSLEYPLRLNYGMISGEKVFFLDSTMLKTCEDGNASGHKVTKGFSAWGKNAEGRSYGFKLHGVCDGKGNLLNICFGSADLHDNKALETLTEGLQGVFVGDAGYLLKQEAFECLFEKHKRISAGVRKNMWRLMTKEQGDLLRKRNVIGW
jgi:hypothetical protein